MKKTAKLIKDKPKMDKAHRPILIALCVVFFIYTITLIFPFAWMIYNSVRDHIDFMFRLWEVPNQILFSNYLDVFSEFDLLPMLGNSIIICVAVPTLTIFMSSCLAYALTKFNFKINKIIYLIAISNMFIPVAGSVASMFKLMSDLHLINNHFGFIIMSSAGTGFNFLLMYATFKNISPTYSEAAEIDGAGQWRTFLQIIMPQVIPVCTSIWLISFIGVWSAYETPYLFLRSHETIATGIKSISDSVEGGEMNGQYPKLFCAIIITTIPMIVLFLVFQNKIMSFSMGGGIKE